MTTSKKEQEKQRQVNKETVDKEREKALRSRFIRVNDSDFLRKKIIAFFPEICVIMAFIATMYHLLYSKENILWDLLGIPDMQARIIGAIFTNIIALILLYIIYARKTKTGGKRK